MKKLFSFIVFTSITLIALLSMTLNGSFYSAKEHMMNVKHKTVELAQRDSLYADCFEFKSNWNNGYGWFVDKRACVIKTYFELEKEPSSLEIWIHVFFL